MTSPDAITIMNTQPEHCDAVSQLICVAYNVPDAECDEAHQIPSGDQLRIHIARFSEGQFVALDGDRVVGQALTMRTHYPPDHEAKTWLDAIGGLSIDNHEPDGEWLYGVEFTVHPDYRRLGVGTKLYQVRFEMVKRLNLRGFYAVGMLMGYHRYQDQMSVQEYGQKVIRREIDDPTVTMQMNRGFRGVGVVEDYLDEDPAGDAGVLIVWDNPDYQA